MSLYKGLNILIFNFKEKSMKIKDHFLSQEIFEIKETETKGVFKPPYSIQYFKIL
jgi:hypothetical protein